jgi:hypothetical protein
MAHCRFEKKLVPYAHGALCSSEKLKLEEHLSHCSNCQEQLQLLRVLEHMPVPAINDESDIWPSLRATILERQRVPWWRTRSVMALGFASFLFGLITFGSMKLVIAPNIVAHRPTVPIVTQSTKTPPVVVADQPFGDIITGFPINFRSELSSRSHYASDKNTDPQLPGLMACLSSPLVRNFEPVGPQLQRTSEPYKPVVKGSDVDEDQTSSDETSSEEVATPIEKGEELITSAGIVHRFHSTSQPPLPYPNLQIPPYSMLLISAHSQKPASHPFHSRIDSSYGLVLWFPCRSCLPACSSSN